MNDDENKPIQIEGYISAGYLTGFKGMLSHKEMQRELRALWARFIEQGLKPHFIFKGLLEELVALETAAPKVEKEEVILDLCESAWRLAPKGSKLRELLKGANDHVREELKARADEFFRTLKSCQETRRDEE
jgi:hypothetical protein